MARSVPKTESRENFQFKYMNSERRLNVGLWHVFGCSQVRERLPENFFHREKKIVEKVWMLFSFLTIIISSTK